MAASQGRLLMITARMSDVEFSSQQLQSAKMRLAMSTEDLTAVYTNALDKMKLVGNTFVDGKPATVDLTYSSLTSANSQLAGKYILTNAENKVLVPIDVLGRFNVARTQGGMMRFASDMSGDSNNSYYQNLYTKMLTDGCTDIAPANQNSATWLNNQLENGGVFLEKLVIKDGKSQFEDSDVTTSSELSQVRDTTDIKVIEAKYDAEMAKIQNKDKRFDMSIKQLDTEHNALQTEAESVKKVIEKNIESSFKTFG